MKREIKGIGAYIIGFVLSLLVTLGNSNNSKTTRGVLLYMPNQYKVGYVTYPNNSKIYSWDYIKKHRLIY